MIVALKLLAAWCVVSVIVSLLIGRIFHVTRGTDQ